MRIPTSIRSELTLKRKLFGYMLLLVLLLLLSLMAGLFLLGRYLRPEKDTYYALDVQMDVFEKSVSNYFDNLAAAGIRLSETAANIIEAELRKAQTNIDTLSDNESAIAAVQEALIEPLRQRLLLEHCSGIFVLLDATVNSTLDQAATSRTGLYLQINGYAPEGENTLLYHGSAEIGKRHGIRPHSKWRLEFDTEVFPDYSEILALAEQPLNQAFLLTAPTVLPGTSEQVMLLALPMVGSDGSLYGICGIEISSSFFMSYHAQPTKIQHLTCLLTTGNNSILNADHSMSCGTADGYYRVPHGSLQARTVTGDLLAFVGDSVDYIGVTRSITLSPNNEAHRLAVMMLREDYDQLVHKATLQTVLLWLLLLFFAVNCCLIFSRRFLSPLLRGLEQLKTADHPHSNIPEIDDLFSFLSEKDREYDKNVQDLTQKMLQAQEEKDRLLQEYEQAKLRYESAQTEISRLSYRMKQEIDPDVYQIFLNGINDLTPTERKIFDLYFQGRSGKEIQELLQIKENTLKFHNKGIYSKLGVNSRKQLLQYAELMKQQS